MEVRYRVTHCQIVWVGISDLSIRTSYRPSHAQSKHFHLLHRKFVSRRKACQTRDLSDLFGRFNNVGEVDWSILIQEKENAAF